MLLRSLSLCLLLCLPACDDGGLPIDGGAPDRRFPRDLAPPPPDLAIPPRDPEEHPPQLSMSYQGGRLLKNIDVGTVVWAGDTALAQARADFASWLVGSDYYKILEEYGIGPGTARGPVVLPGPAPTTLDDSGVGPLIRAALADG